MSKSKIPVAVKSPVTKNNDDQKSKKKKKKVTSDGGDLGSTINSPMKENLISEDDESSNGHNVAQIRVKNSPKNRSPKSEFKSNSSSSTIEKCDISGEIDDIKIDYHDEWISPIQNYFIWSISAIYMFAFVSFYMQVRGLYGNKGVLPLRYFAVKYVDPNETVSLDSINRAAPSLVWYLASTQGLSLTSSLELISLAGSLISFIQLLSNSFRTPIIYLLLFVLYYSCVNVSFFSCNFFLLIVLNDNFQKRLVKHFSTFNGMRFYWNAVH